MCSVLKISRKTFYNYVNKTKIDTYNTAEKTIEYLIEHYFKSSRGSYGTRPIKRKLEKHSYKLSRSKTGKIMKLLGLVSIYNKKSYKEYSNGVNNDRIENLLDRKFNNWGINQVITSDLTYCKVNGKHNYVCFIINLYNRQIIGHAVSDRKTADIVITALTSIPIP
ncbi:MAG: IS3 family transposase, partial [Mycoplasmatales bacterium]